MRALAVLLVVTAACLSGPTGAPRSWPPPLATTDVAAIAAGDLDGDGTSDVIVLVAGTADTGAGAYFLKGGVDVHASAAAPLATFTGYTPLDEVDAPAAAVAVTIGGTRSVVLAYSAHSQLQLTRLDGAALAIKGDGSTEIATTAQDPVWLVPMAFPGNQLRLALGIGDDLRHLDPSALSGTTATVQLIPPPGASWSSPAIATSYTSGSDTIAVIASAASIDRSTIPTQPPPQGMFTWANVRTGTAWTGQAVFDLGNGRADVIGYDATGAQVCAIDPGGGGGAPPCTPSAIAGDAIVPGAFGGAAAPDLAIVHTGGGGAQVQFLGDVTFSSSSFTAATTTQPQTTTVAGAGAHAVAYGGGVLLVGADGSAACVGLAGACQ
jgi:hypothetical protein